MLRPPNDRADCAIARDRAKSLIFQVFLEQLKKAYLARKGR
jgi:hypothetical protein